MAGIEFIDQTGQPTTEDDIKESLRAVENVMVKDMLKVPPELAVQLGTIIRALKELIGFKQLIKKLKKEKEKT
jgi:hypothetical protein